MMPGALYVMIAGLMWMLVLLAGNWATPDSVSNVLTFYTTTTLTLLADDLFILEVTCCFQNYMHITFACLCLCVIHLHCRCYCIF